MSELDLFSESIRRKFEIYSYRNAAAILASSFPAQFSHVINALEKFEITTQMIRRPGGSKGEIARYVDTLFPSPDWIETRISADLHVRLEHAKKSGHILHEYIRKSFLMVIELISFQKKWHLIWSGIARTKHMIEICMRFRHFMMPVRLMLVSY